MTGVLTHCSACRCRVREMGTVEAHEPTAPDHWQRFVWTGHDPVCERVGMAPDARAADVQHPHSKPHKRRRLAKQERGKS